MEIIATFVIEFGSAEQRDRFVCAATSGGSIQGLQRGNVDVLEAYGSRRRKFAATIVLPIALGVAGNLATDVVREAAKDAWAEIVEYAHALDVPPKKMVITEPPELVGVDAPLIFDPKRKKTKK
jgi:hypothetical protein